MRILQCNLSYYSYKLHNFYCLHITNCHFINCRVFYIWNVASNIGCCQIKEVGINFAHTFNNINKVELSLLSFSHCTTKTLHPTHIYTNIFVFKKTKKTFKINFALFLLTELTKTSNVHINLMNFVNMFKWH